MGELRRDGWDIIVVGAGSAGAAVAARCAERGRRVLLLEAGPDYRSADMHEKWRSPNSTGAVERIEETGTLIWQDIFATRTDAQAPRVYWRGKGLGGSSAINGQIAIRPPVNDHEDWVADGCVGWGWDDVLPYYNRLEADELYGDRPYHGDSGPIPVHRMPRERWGAVDEAFTVAGLAHGFPWADDINAPGATGVSPYPINSRDGRRVTTNDGYLEPLRDSENLTIVGDALVDRVLIEGTRAVGVRVLIGGEAVDIRGGEVVLSAGSVDSPATLVRSGIGRADRLRDLETRCVADLPVGEGLQDHVWVKATLLLTEDATMGPDDRWTNAALRYTSGLPDASFNDMMMIASNVASFAVEFADGTAVGGSIGVWLNRPHSRGQVFVDSLDPRARPFMRENMLADRRDLARMREGVRHVYEMCQDPAVAQIVRVPVDEANPRFAEVVRAGDDDALDAYMRAVGIDTQHITSTCRMGDPSAPTTVVDPELRVLGVEALRVADASIMPQTTRSNTHFAAVMVGERCADLITGSTGSRH
jgi:choline dehydrogenase